MGHAIKILRGYVHEAQKEAKDAKEITDRILHLKSTLTADEQKLYELTQEIERIKPFGEFSVTSLESLEQEIGRRVRFFAAKATKNLGAIEPALIKVNEQDGIDYFIAIQNEPIVFNDLIELYFAEPLSALLQKEQALKSAIEASHAELKTLTCYNLLLHEALVTRLNVAHLGFAEEMSEFELENQLFVVEGWVPKTALSALQELTERHQVYKEKVAIDKLQTPPTYLENRGTAKVGEDLIRVFDTPSIRDSDPSLWVLFAFSLFFSMIVNDAGYGMLYLAVALFLRFRVKKLTGDLKRFLSLVTILAATCMLWGRLTHSIFGMHFGPESFIRKHSLMTWLIKQKAEYCIATNNDTFQYYQNQYPQLGKKPTAEQLLYVHGPKDVSEHPVASKFTDNVLLELSLFLGAIHICIGLLRYIRKNPVGLGWIAFIVGAYLYIPYFLQANSLIHYVFWLPKQAAAEFGLQLMLFGISFASIAGAITHGVAGLFEWTHAVQVFADVLSYLRIYALGYAGLIVAETVNMLGAKLPFVLAVAVIVFGHLLNMTIAILGGTIHGLRLNFLEWYRYSFFGGGKEFRPLQLMTLE